jgi:hypothetical protein
MGQRVTKHPAIDDTAYCDAMREHLAQLAEDLFQFAQGLIT